MGGATVMSKEDFRVLVSQAMDRRGIRTKKEIAEQADRDASWVSRITTGSFKETPPPEDLSHACGQRMYLICIQQTSTRTRYSEHFYCRGVYQTPKCRHPRRQISRPKLDAAVRQCLAVDLAGILPIADALQRAVVTAGGPETMQRRRTLEEKRARILARYERVRDAWAAGMESLDWLADEQAKRDSALAELDAELAGLPDTPDPDQYARVGAQLQSVAAVLPELDDGALTALLAELGTVLVDGDGVRMVYGPAVAPFVPSPHIADVG